jgi:shikimate kinase
MKGKGVSHGAATIVNAIAHDKGAAFGMDMMTVAEVELHQGEGIEVEIQGGEDITLASTCVRNVLRRCSPDQELGARVRTESDIPVSRGLKSSSAAANAIVMATLDALSVQLEPLEAIRIGTASAVEAGVSVTGAFDDATACWLGGVVITDNQTETILRRDRLPEDLRVLLHVPERKIRKVTLPLERIRAMAPIANTAFELAMEGDYYWALTMNGICYSAALDLDQELAMEAMHKGALAAGVTGTGPATVVLVKEDLVEDMLGELDRWDLRLVELYHGED